MALRLALADFRHDGVWDCQHSIEPSTMYDAWRALGYPTDPEAAINIVREMWHDDPEDWLAQQVDDLDGLDPTECYRAWREGWQATAERYVRSWMPRWVAERAEDLAG